MRLPEIVRKPFDRFANDDELMKNAGLKESLPLRKPALSSMFLNCSAVIAAFSMSIRLASSRCIVNFR